MCEYCGCQDIPAIGELTREHDAVVAHIAEVRACLRDDSIDGAAKVSRLIAQLLGPHTVVEEEGLFPLMAEEFPDHIEALEREHRQIESVLAEAADGTPDDPTWPARLLAGLELLREHILKEQDGVFPATLTVLDTAGWEQVATVRGHAGSALDPPHQHHSHPSDHHHGLGA